MITDPIMWTYILLTTISNELTKDELKRKRRFMLSTMIYGACESVWLNNCEILFVVSVIVSGMNFYWREDKG